MASIDIAARRRTDGLAKLGQLTNALDKWEAESKDRLQTHWSQIQAALATLRTVVELLQGTDASLRPDEMSTLILSAHRVWDFYRARLEQRLSGESKAFLDVADQLAYDCYEPIAKLLGKAPPLVVLTGSSQPYVQARQSPFLVEGVVTREGLDARAAKATKELPFPVIGLPRWQPVQLGGLVAVAHEVGHAVEDDLDCTSSLQAVFDAGGARAADWKRWQRELFADLWGCLCCGPAFAVGLADYLAPLEVWKEPVDRSSVYPPAWLRVRFAFRAAMAMCELTGESREKVVAQYEGWQTVYPFEDDWGKYLDDIESILATALAMPLPGLGTFKALDLCFTPDKQKAAESLASRWTSNWTPTWMEEVTRMQVGAAAMRLAYESDPAYVSQLDIDKIVGDTLHSALTNDRRSSSDATKDTERGKRLFEALAGDYRQG